MSKKCIKCGMPSYSSDYCIIHRSLEENDKQSNNQPTLSDPELITKRAVVRDNEPELSDIDGKTTQRKPRKPRGTSKIKRVVDSED